jgi:UDP-glucose 4-epimerase
MSPPLLVLVSGGAGYIGSHTIIELLRAGHRVICLDNYSNSDATIFERIRTIVGVSAFSRLQTIECDISNSAEFDHSMMHQPAPDWIIHFAAFKNVGESAKKPLDYYYNNLVGFLNILRYAKESGCRNFIFSSSATVYAHDAPLPYREIGGSIGALDKRYETIRNAPHPYGNTKVVCEQILHDLVATSPTAEPWNVVILRYFNPVGNHVSGLIGDSYKRGRANNLFPAILGAVAAGEEMSVFGGDYPGTVDGTPARDYIHVVDLAVAHVGALGCTPTGDRRPYCYNVGLGRAYTVKEVLDEFAHQGLPARYRVVERRRGDVEASFCDNTAIVRDLGWQPQNGLSEMVRDTIRFFRNDMR